MGVLEARELNETELSEGESRGGLWAAGAGAGLGAGDADGVGGARFLPLPRTRPPPRLLREAMVLSAYMAASCSSKMPSMLRQRKSWMSWSCAVL